MIRALLILLAAACPAFGQVGITVMADTNRAVRTNFTIGNAQVTGLSALLDAKLATNGNGAALTNLTGGNVVGTVATASNITGILAISNGGTGSSSASNARTALGLGTAATNDATNFQAASTNLTALASGDGSSLTNISGAANPTGNGGSLTNIASTNIVGTVALASNIVGTLSITNGGTGGTNATSGLANLLPAYLSNASKVLAVTTNETGVEWITAGGGGGSGTVTSIDASGGSTGMSFSGGPVTTNGTLTLGGTLAIGSGGTGAGDITNARINLLPSYTGNSNKVLALNSGGTDLEWVTAATGVVSISVGGTGGTNTNTALQGLGLVNSNGSVYTLLTEAFDFAAIRLATTNTGAGISIGSKTTTASGNFAPIAIGHLAQVATNSGVAIGREATVINTTNSRDGSASAAEGAAIGPYTYARSGGSVGRGADTFDGGSVGNNAYSIFGGAIGKGANTEDGGAIGWDAYSVDGFAAGKYADASASNSVQLLEGANNSNNTIQFLSAGSVNTNRWSYLANASTKGGSRMTNTNGVTATNTIIGYDGTNYTTNTITVLDGIITSWTQ